MRPFGRAATMLRRFRTGSGLPFRVDGREAANLPADVPGLAREPDFHGSHGADALNRARFRAPEVGKHPV